MSRDRYKKNHLNWSRETLEKKSQILLLRFRPPGDRLHSKTYKSQTITIYELKFWDMKIDF